MKASDLLVEALEHARAADFLPALRGALEAGGIRIIDVPIDYSENRIFTRELEQLQRTSTAS